MHRCGLNQWWLTDRQVHPQQQADNRYTIRYFARNIPPTAPQFILPQTYCYGSAKPILLTRTLTLVGLHRLVDAASVGNRAHQLQTAHVGLYLPTYVLKARINLLPEPKPGNTNGLAVPLIRVAGSDLHDNSNQGPSEAHRCP